MNAPNKLTAVTEAPPAGADLTILGAPHEAYEQDAANRAPWQTLAIGANALMLYALNGNRITGATLGTFLDKAPHTGNSVAALAALTTGIGASVEIIKSRSEQ